MPIDSVGKNGSITMMRTIVMSRTVQPVQYLVRYTLNRRYIQPPFGDLYKRDNIQAKYLQFSQFLQPQLRRNGYDNTESQLGKIRIGIIKYLYNVIYHK